MIIKGFRFGMILQIAIGPVFIYLFKVATESGFFAAEVGVLAATLMDAIFVLLAVLGIGSLLEKPSVKFMLKYFGMIIIVYFGLGIILAAFGINIIPTLRDLAPSSMLTNAFVTTFILTASSPLSILFWTGVFATKVSCEGYCKKEMKLFGAGAVLATLAFLTVCSLLISMLHLVISNGAINVLNLVVGIIIIGFGIKMGCNRVTPSVVSEN